MPLNAKLRASKNCIDLIKEFEKCSLVAYLCPSKIPTIGFGHTGSDVKMGMTCTQEQADHWLRVDLMRSENTIKAFVGVDINQNQFDALSSFIFNIGRFGFMTSSVHMHINKGEYDKARDSFRLWNKGGPPGKVVVLAGLVRRREWEINLWNTGKVFGPKR